MTAGPLATDPLTAFSQHAGGTRAHHQDHQLLDPTLSSVALLSAANTFAADQSIAPTHRLSFQNTPSTPDNSSAPWQLQISGAAYDKVFRIQYNANADGSHIDPTMHAVRMAWESRWTAGDPAVLQGGTEWYLEVDRDKTGSNPRWRRPFAIYYDMDNEAVAFTIGSVEDTWWKLGALAAIRTRAYVGSDDGNTTNNVLTVGSDVPDGSIGALTMLNLSAHFAAAWGGDFLHAYKNGVLQASINGNGDIWQRDGAGITAGAGLTFSYAGYAQIEMQPGARLIVGLDADTSYVEFQRQLYMANKDIRLSQGTGTKIGTNTLEKLAFWNATPVVQQVLATGTGKTVDNVITLLQTLGLVKQS